MAKFVDTTIQVERLVKQRDKGMQKAIEKAVGDEHLVACSYSRLEFKRSVIQQISLALDYLVTEESYFGALDRCQRLRRDRQSRMLVSLLSWTGHELSNEVEVSTGDDIDTLLAMKGRAFLKNAIMHLWFRFDAIVDAVVDGTECQRAREEPRKTRTGKLDVAISAQACKSGQCRNREFIQERKRLCKDLCSRLEGMESNGGLTDELRTALRSLQSALQKHNLNSLLEYGNCADIGDIWIHLECVANKVTDFVTTNYKESNVLCPLLDLNPVVVTRPPPATIKKFRHDPSSEPSVPRSPAESERAKEE